MVTNHLRHPGMIFQVVGPTPGWCGRFRFFEVRARRKYMFAAETRKWQLLRGYMGVSKTRGTPKWMIYNRNPY